SSVMPAAIRPYGIHSGGAHDDEVVCLSTQDSCHSVHDFHAKKAQKASETISISSRRMRFQREGSAPAIASMPMWPRKSCTWPAHKKVTPTRQNTAASSCQSVAALNR